MPTLELVSPSGRRYELTGDRVPTDTELAEIIASLEPAPKPTREEITADVEAKTAAATPRDTATKATSAMAGSAVRAATDPILGAANILARSGLPDALVGGTIGQLATAARVLSPVITAGAAAEEVAAGTPGNETVAEVAGAVGSGLGSMPAAFLGPAGLAASSVSAGLGSYEQTRREALAAFEAAGLPPEEADKSAHRVALGAGAITGGVTGAFNAIGGRFGLGRGVERGLGDPVRKLTVDELKKSAARPMVEAFIRETGGEATEEAIDQALQEGLVRWQYDKTQTFADAVKNVIKAGVLGGVAGGVIGGVPAAAGAVGERRQAVRAIRQAEAAQVPGDAPAAPPVLDLPQTPVELPADMQKAPGTWVYGVTADGKPFEAHTGTDKGDAQTVRDYIERAMPGAKVARVDFVEDMQAAEVPASEPEQITPVTPEPDKETPTGGVTPGPVEQPAGVVAPASTQEANEEVQAQEQEEVLTPAPSAPATPPVQGPKKPNPGLESIRSIEANRPPDFLDWVENNVGRIRSKSKASQAASPYYDVNFEAAARGSARNLFSATGEEIDVVAQQAFEAGQISEPTPDAVWEAMIGARGGREAYRKQERGLLREGREMAQQVDRFERAAVQGKRDGRLANRTVQDVPVGDLMPGDEFMVAGEKVVVSQFIYDPETDEMTGVELQDGRKFGTQVVDGGTVIKVDSGTLQRSAAPGAGEVAADPDQPFSLRQPDGDLFGAPETVEQQKARLAREAAEKKAREDRQKMLDRQAAPLVGRSVDATGDMFDPMAGDAPLFQQPTKPKRPQQGSFFSTRETASQRAMTPEQVTGFVTRIFGGKAPPGVVVSEQARATAGGALVEGAFDPASGQVVLYAPNLRGEADVRRVLRHELLHGVYEDGKVAQSWRMLRAMLTGEDLARVRAEGYTSNEEEEAALDSVEARVDKKAGLFRRWVNAIVDALNRRGAADWAGAVFGVDRLADSDARLLVRYAMRLEGVATGSQEAGGRSSLREQVDAGGTTYDNAVVRGPARFSIRAYHGTPHKVDRFTTEKIGTGEGAQAFGWGLYFAEKKDVAKAYAEQLGAGVFEYDGKPVVGSDLPNDQDARRIAVELLWSWSGDKDGAISDADGYDQANDIKRILKTLDFAKIRKGGRTYAVELDVNDDQLIDHDGDIASQPDAVKNVVRDMLKSQGFLGANDNGPRQLVSAWRSYRMQARGLGVSDGDLAYELLGNGGDGTASKAWLAKGIRGIKYLDEGSRGARGKRTRNFVIFDDRFIRIVESSGERLSLRTVTSDPAALKDEQARQKEAGKAVTPVLSELIGSGVEVSASLGASPTFSQWAKAMAEKHGDGVRPLLRTAWDRLDDLRWSLQNGMSPDSQGVIADIIAEAEAAPSALDPKIPPPVYDPDKTVRWWTRWVRKSDNTRFYGSAEMLTRKGELDLRTAYQAAEVRKQSDALMAQLEDSLYGGKAGPIMRFWRQFAPKPKLRQFMRFALPIAARLNVTGGRPGEFVFKAFNQRAGFLPLQRAASRNLETGQSIQIADPITGKMEDLEIGARITLQDGRDGYQLLRPMSAEQQTEVYQWAEKEFPAFMWFLNTYLDPRLADLRVTVNGVQMPVFNRMALAGQYAETDPGFRAREAYTPDVYIGQGILKKFLTERRPSFRQGISSPGRLYETGSARESGQVLDLLSGFNVRAMQVMQEQVRQEWARYVLGQARDIPDGGLPPVGWVRIETAMQDIIDADRRLKQPHPLDFPQLDPNAPAPQVSPQLERMFGRLARMPREGPPKMIPKPLVDALLSDLAVTEQFGALAQLLQTAERNWKAFLLLMPTTFAVNRTDNYLRFFMHGYQRLWYAALKGGDREAFREARKLTYGMVANLIPGVRPLLGIHDNALFEKVRERVLPDEIFAGEVSTRELWVDSGDTTRRIESQLAQGDRRGAIGTAAMNLGPLILEKTGYGSIDVRAKQQFAFSILLARAEEAAWRKGLRGGVRDKFIEQWMMAPPEKDVVDAVEAAGKNLLRYGDTPDRIAKLIRIPGFNTFVAFPLFRYHWVGRELDRGTAAFRAFHKMLVRGKKLSRDEWAESLADTISYVTLPLMGYAGAKVAGALTDSLIGGLGDDEDDEDPRQFVGASSVYETSDDGGIRRKPLPRELVVANRLNVSAMLRQAGVNLAGEQDYWLQVKDLPFIRSTALFYLAAEDARNHGLRAGAITLASGIKDLLSSLTGVGQSVKIPAKLLAEIEAEDKGRPVPSLVDPYATNVPLDAYITLQLLNLIPGGRQADEVIKWLDPVPRRITRSKTLGYDPGVVEAAQLSGWTGLADRLARGLMDGDFASPLPPQGLVDRSTGTVTEPREFDLRTRIASLLGQNIKPIPRREYREALTDGLAE